MTRPADLDSNARPIEEDKNRTPDTQEEGETNPPWTTTGKITSPKFGSAGSGGAEYEPGPKRN